MKIEIDLMLGEARTNLTEPDVRKVAKLLEQMLGRTADISRGSRLVYMFRDMTEQEHRRLAHALDIARWSVKATPHGFKASFGTMTLVASRSVLILNSMETA